MAVGSVSPHVDKKKKTQLSKSRGRMIGYPRNVKRTLGVRGKGGSPWKGKIRDMDTIIADLDRKARISGRHHP